MIKVITMHAPMFARYKLRLVSFGEQSDVPTIVSDEIWFGIIDNNPTHKILSGLIMVGLHK